MSPQIPGIIEKVDKGPVMLNVGLVSEKGRQLFSFKEIKPESPTAIAIHGFSIVIMDGQGFVPIIEPIWRDVQILFSIRERPYLDGPAWWYAHPACMVSGVVIPEVLIKEALSRNKLRIATRIRSLEVATLRVQTLGTVNFVGSLSLALDADLDREV